MKKIITIIATLCFAVFGFANESFQDQKSTVNFELPENFKLDSGRLLQDDTARYFFFAYKDLPLDGLSLQIVDLKEPLTLAAFANKYVEATPGRFIASGEQELLSIKDSKAIYYFTLHGDKGIALIAQVDTKDATEQQQLEEGLEKMALSLKFAK